MHIPAALQATLDRLVGALAPERIVLFGSYAKGDAHPGSDIDLLVVAEVAGDLEFYLRSARHLVARSFPRIDLVICTKDDLEQASAGRLPFIQSALETGITVYRRV